MILHNMIINDERGLELEFFYDNVGSHVNRTETPIAFKHCFERHRQTEDSGTHTQLNLDLIKHQCSYMP
jgi:hypothetical protein